MREISGRLAEDADPASRRELEDGSRPGDQALDLAVAACRQFAAQRV
jgi:hypothetical protein